MQEDVTPQMQAARDNLSAQYAKMSDTELDGALQEQEQMKAHYAVSGTRYQDRIDRVQVIVDLIQKERNFRRNLQFEIKEMRDAMLQQYYNSRSSEGSAGRYFTWLRLAKAEMMQRGMLLDPETEQHPMLGPLARLGRVARRVVQTTPGIGKELQDCILEVTQAIVADKQKAVEFHNAINERFQMLVQQKRERDAKEQADGN